MKITLQKPTKKFIRGILDIYEQEEGNELNENLLKLFKTFNNDLNRYNVLIKVASLNKIYSTAITNINPVVEQIIKITKENNKFKNYVSFVDKISKIEWTNSKGITFKRNNMSFASKYVHFLSNYETPIYDSYIWIIIKGYLGQKNGELKSFNTPKSFKEFYATFYKFKKELNLENYSNYEIDKFLWQYGKKLILEIESELKLTIAQSKSELKKRIKAYNN